MNKTLMMSVVFGVAGLMSAAQLTLADSQCQPHDYFDGKPYVKRAKAAEQAGRFKDAYKEAKLSTGECATGVDDTQANALMARVAHKQGLLDEKRGGFLEAADWFEKAQGLDDIKNYDDIDRVMMKYARSAPTDLKVFEKAHGHFTNRHLGPGDPNMKELQRIALANGEKELAGEAKAFTPLRDTRQELSRARDWLQYVDGGKQKVFDRATQRGDSLAKDDAPGPFERALEYYRQVQNTQKEKQLQDRANRLGDAHAGKGEDAVALRYYRIAGRDDKGDKFEKETDTKREKAETQRKKEFKKGQDSLEKELGL